MGILSNLSLDKHSHCLITILFIKYCLPNLRVIEPQWVQGVIGKDFTKYLKISKNS